MEPDSEDFPAGEVPPLPLIITAEGGIRLPAPAGGVPDGE